MSRKPQNAEEKVKMDDFATKATIAEVIELKFFQCETRLRELISTITDPAVQRSRQSFDNSLFV